MSARRIEMEAERLASSSTAVNILEASLRKLLQNPQNERYRKVNLSNPVMKRVCEQPGASDLLHAAGWEYHYGYLLMNHFNPNLVRQAVQALQRIQQSNPLYLKDRELVKREEERAQTQAEAERIQEERRKSYAAKVPDEPPENEGTAAKICLHLTDGKTVWRRFDSTVDTLQDLLNFVKSLKGAPDSLRLENITQNPSRVLNLIDGLGCSLHHLDLWPAGHVRVSCAA